MPLSVLACARARPWYAQLKMKMEPVDVSLHWLEAEDETGAIEYKLRLNNPHPIRLQQLVRPGPAAPQPGTRARAFPALAPPPAGVVWALHTPRCRSRK